MVAILRARQGEPLPVLGPVIGSWSVTHFETFLVRDSKPMTQTSSGFVLCAQMTTVLGAARARA
jgi:hypothetical protein